MNIHPRFAARAARMIPRAFSRLTAATLALTLIAYTGGAAPATSGGSQEVDKGWPRLYKFDGNEVVLHQPQVDDWRDYTLLVARLAVSVKPKDAKEPVFGVVELQWKTAADHEARLVTLYKPEIVGVRFTGIPPEQAAQLEAVVRAVPATRDPVVIALDRVLAYVKMGEHEQKGVAVNMDPPPIYYSDREAVLVMFLGEPRFDKIEGAPLEYGANTNWDLFRDPAAGTNYLLYRDSWFVTGDLLKGKWTVAKSLPKAFNELPKDEAWERIRKSVPGKPTSSAPVVVVTAQPAEIITTKGKPAFEAIPKTKLAFVSNSDNTLFLHQGEGQFYFMAAGRWFRAKELTGPWSAATTTLPKDFANIPKNHPKAYVLASVPGTQEAEDAVLLASIPKTAVVDRAKATVQVSYDGAPEFQPIEKTSVQYAVNTPNDVFKVGDSYYACYQAVWFVSPSPSGPFVVATSVPKEIYTIPPTSPKYNVTYVTIYESTPTTVTCGHTSGYNGEVVAAGVVMFGLGMAIGASMYPYPYHFPPYYYGYGYPRPPYYGHYSYYSSPHGYGWSASGPYGSAGYKAGYNPATGTYGRAGYVATPYGAAGARSAYNPYTGNAAHQRGGANAYGSWTQGAVTNGTDWARGGTRSNSQGTAAGFRTSTGAAGAGYSGDKGSGFVVQDGKGNVYAGKDGNVYKRDQSGGWTNSSGETVTPPSRDQAASPKATSTQQASGTGTKPSASKQPSASTQQASGGKSAGTRPSSSAAQQPAPRASTSSAGTSSRPSSGSFGSSPSSFSGSSVGKSLNSDYQARQSGNKQASQFSGRSSARSSGGGARRRP